MDEQDSISILAERHALWSACLNSDDPNSVGSQLHVLTWNAAAFRTVNEARRLNANERGGMTELNGLMHSLLDRLFWEGQSNGVRRIADCSSPLKESKRSKDKSVYSLAALLRDMLDHVSLMTRENWFAVADVEYDVALVSRRLTDFLAEALPEGRGAAYIPRHADAGFARSLHKEFDAISGVAEKNRTRSDGINAQFFLTLEHRMKAATSEIIECANKYYAHAATPASRESAGVGDLSITLSKLAEAQKILCMIHCSLNRHIFRVHQPTYLPIPNFDPLKYVERPLVSAAQVPLLREFWKTQERVARTYTAWQITEIIGENTGV